MSCNVCSAVLGGEEYTVCYLTETTPQLQATKGNVCRFPINLAFIRLYVYVALQMYVGRSSTPCLRTGHGPRSSVYCSGNIRGQAVKDTARSSQPAAESYSRMFPPAACHQPKKYSTLSAPACRPIRINFYQLVCNDWLAQL